MEHFAQLAEDPERRIHESRKNLKRARAFLALVAPGLPKATVRREEKAYRDVARKLSAARDAVVLRKAFEAERESVGLTPEQLEAARAALQYGDEPSVGGDYDDARIVLGQALERLPEWTSELQSWKSVASGFVKTYRRARRGMVRAADTADGDDFHAWRKHVKRHLYQSDLLRAVWPKKLGARDRRLDKLAEALGRAHDLFELDRALRTAEVSSSDLEAHLHRRRTELEAEALALGGPLFKVRPVKLRKRLKTRLLEFAGAAYLGIATREASEGP